MATVLNMAKEARKKSKEAEELQAEAVFLYIEEKPVGYIKLQAEKAREATIEANEANRMVLSQLEKNSALRSIYESYIKKNEVFLEATQQ